MTGIRTTRPGPLAPMVRPSRKTTRRWYSRTILRLSFTSMANMATSRTPMTIPTTNPTSITAPSLSARLPGRRLARLLLPAGESPDAQFQALPGHDLNGLSGADRLALRHGRPLLVVHQHRPLRGEGGGGDARRAGQPQELVGDRHPPRAQAGPQGKQEEGGQQATQRHQQPAVHLGFRRLGP